MRIGGIAFIGGVIFFGSLTLILISNRNENPPEVAGAISLPQQNSSKIHQVVETGESGARGLPSFAEYKTTVLAEYGRAKQFYPLIIAALASGDSRDLAILSGKFLKTVGNTSRMAFPYDPSSGIPYDAVQGVSDCRQAILDLSFALGEPDLSSASDDFPIIGERQLFAKKLFRRSRSNGINALVTGGRSGGGINRKAFY